MKSLKKSTLALLLAIVLMVGCSIASWGVVTGWGNVKITHLSLVADNGLRYTGLMYVPASATNETPAPLAIFYHGNSGNGRNHEMQAMEYARRGFVCISADNNGGGDAEYSNKTGNQVAADLFTRYALGLSIIDPENVVMAGHSMGGDLTVVMAVKYQPKVTLISDNGGMGDEGIIHGNVMYLNGLADKLNPLDVYRERATKRFVAQGQMAEGEQIVPGQLYGSFEAGNAAMLAEIPNQVHEGAITSGAHLEAMLDFTMKCMEVPNPIAANNQKWQTSMVIGMLGMFAFVFFLISLAVCLIDQMPFFAGVRQGLPRNIGMRGKELAVSIVAAIAFPVACLYFGCFGLEKVLGGRNPATPLFRVAYANFGLAIVVCLNLFGAAMFLLYHFTWGKKKFRATLRDYGLAEEGKQGLNPVFILKSLALALIVVAIGWAYLQFQSTVLGTDFYCLYFGFKAIALHKAKFYVPYVVAWCLCFVVAAEGMCVERRLPSTGKEGLDTLIAVLFNTMLATLSISACVIIQHLGQINLGTTATSFASWGIDMTRIWGMPAGMFIAGAGNTYCYRKTGNVWLSAFLMGTVCALSACLYGQIKF